MHLNPPEVGGFCPMASPILIGFLVPCSPLVVGRVQQIWKARHQEKIVDKIGTESTPGTDDGTELLETGATLLKNASPLIVSSVTRALATVLALSVFSAVFSTICIKAYVTVVSGNRSLPRWVQGVE